ncbi:glycosyltransferase [Actinoplanes sp. N902-109]|uniref:glycosyltransferase n=1 Tax=Actinoplanes sp. (strain N902-109) TaxID=649831 RepID=UPI0003296020|nr:glycosyltransferase [Actinoplanes sp. N902-109]AGL20836.1 glycosyl transferase [Actinoplanes sp. N902-109]
MVSVLHVTQPTSGGVARVVLGLAKAQQESGLDVAVAAPAGELSEKLLAAGVPWQRWDSSRQPGPSLTDERRALKHIIAGRDPDLVHLHSSKAGLVGRLALRGRVPTVFQPHAWSFLAAEGRTRIAATKWEQYATRWTDLILYCSLQEQKDGASHGIDGPGRIVLNGVDLTQFRAPTPADRAAGRRLLGLPADAFVAAVVGRRSEQKGQDIALQAWQAVRSAAPSAVLVLMGEGYEDGYSAAEGVMTRAAGDNVRSVFAAADVVLSPSRWEGLSLSLLEGMATARPTIASDVAGSREALIEGPLPAAGAVVEREDVDALSREILARLHNPDLVRREAAAARSRIETSFNETATTRSVMDAYRLLLIRAGSVGSTAG